MPEPETGELIQDRRLRRAHGETDRNGLPRQAGAGGPRELTEDSEAHAHTQAALPVDDILQAGLPLRQRQNQVPLTI